MLSMQLLLFRSPKNYHATSGRTDLTLSFFWGLSYFLSFVLLILLFRICPTFRLFLPSLPNFFLPTHHTFWERSHMTSAAEGEGFRNADKRGRGSKPC